MTDKEKKQLDSQHVNAIKESLSRVIELVSAEANDGRKPNENFIKLITERSRKDPQKVVNTLMNYYFEMDKATDMVHVTQFKKNFLDRNKKSKMQALHRTKTEGECDDVIRNHVDDIMARTKSRLGAQQFFIHRMSDPIRAIRSHIEHSKTVDEKFLSNLKDATDGFLKEISPFVHKNMDVLIEKSQHGEYIRT